MDISVVIPTYNRSKILKRCLLALGEQHTDKGRYEVIVVNDGSEDDTEKTVNTLIDRLSYGLRLINQDNRGQGVARNVGVSEAKGDVVLFLGDDVFPDPDCLPEHLRVHQLNPEPNHGVLGFVTWHPELEVTPLMKFMTLGGAVFGKFGGHQFAYDLLEGKRTADHRFFYTANISLKKSILEKHKFDPWFSGYGWEDIELGYRLEKKENFVLHYNPYAVGYHYHSMTDRDFERRMRAIGRSSHVMHERYPELGKIPSGKKKLAFSLLASKPALGLLKGLHIVAPDFFENMYFYALSKKFFLEGVNRVSGK